VLEAINEQTIGNRNGRQPVSQEIRSPSVPKRSGDQFYASLCCCQGLVAGRCDFSLTLKIFGFCFGTLCVMAVHSFLIVTLGSRRGSGANGSGYTTQSLATPHLHWSMHTRPASKIQLEQQNSAISAFRRPEGRRYQLPVPRVTSWSTTFRSCSTIKYLLGV
jgi:hypothetical protein